MLTDMHAEHIVNAKQIKCRVQVLVDAKNTEFFLVVCNGTNIYVNHFWVDIWNFLEMKKIRMNIFHFPMWQACNQSEN